MAKKKKIYRWKCAALTLLLGAALCTAGCGKEDTSKKEEVAKQEKLADTQTKKVENTSAEAPENTPTETPENTPTEAPVSTPEPTPTEIPGIEFPYEVDGEKLLIEAVFQYTGINPDYQDEMCEDVASIQIKNCSEEYLETAEVLAELTDGTEFTFRVEDVPAGETALVFEANNQSYDGKTSVDKMQAEAIYSAEASLKADAVSITTDEAGIHLKNISSENLSNVIVKYHCSLDGKYFGGICYEGNVESLASGESIVLDAFECYLGEAAVVNVIY